MNEALEKLGWNNFFESKKTEMKLDDFSVARVISKHKGAYKVKNEKGEFLARITGKKMFESKSQEDYPAVGDWITIAELDERQAVIQAILPRKSVIKRVFGEKNKKEEKNKIQVIAANIDEVFIVQSVGRDYNINRFERYLTMLKNENIKSVIIINKIDLISKEELNLKLKEIKKRLNDIKIITTSAANEKGLGELKNYIQKGKTYCFIGSSGVGKSSLINKLLGKDNIKTGEISLHSSRGKHITTKREMYFLEDGGMVIDNPGIREVGIADVNEGIDNVFDEIINLSRSCKYADCTHQHEPGCAVLEAVESGQLDKNRYTNYINLKKETNFYRMSEREKKEKDRNFGKFLKKAKKDFKKSGRKYY